MFKRNGSLIAFVVLAASMTTVSAGFDEGLSAYQAGNYATALNEWMPLAERGDAKAQGQLARLYYRGEGVTKDPKRAADWAKKAADQGDANGENLLGIFITNGDAGFDKDEAEGARWYAKAAEKGLATAQYNLGAAYWDGRGVKEDRERAEFWVRKAAEQGHAGAQFIVGMYLSQNELSETDFDKLAEWLRKSAEQGYAPAQKQLGDFYSFIVTKEMFERAYGLEEVVQLAAWDGIAKAMPHDLVTAYAMYALAAKGNEEQTRREAQARLAKIETQLTVEQKAEGDAIVAAWKPGQPLPTRTKTGRVQK